MTGEQRTRRSPGAAPFSAPFSGARVTLGQDLPLPAPCQEALAHLRQAIAAGRGWPGALLEAMGLWTLPQEVYKGRLHRYLIHGEALDWLLLAQRLADAVDGLIPPPERRRLLREGRLPQELAKEEFQRCLGTAKYRAYLNYWYGVTVETALQEVMRAEVRKELLSRGFSPRARVTSEVFRRIYGEGRASLLTQFLQGREKPTVPLAPWGLMKEFTYWLFKLRLQRSEKARVASDTRRALLWLQRHHPEAFHWPASMPGLEGSLPDIPPGMEAPGGWE